MSYKYEWKSQAEIAALASDLQKATEKIFALAEKMRESNFEKAVLPFSETTQAAIERVLETPKFGEIMLDNQIDARAKGKISKYVKAMEKSKKDAQRRKAKGSASVAEKPVGRPRKKAGG
jgi:hypothetical protein